MAQVPKDEGVTSSVVNLDRGGERTCFQTGSPWSLATDVRSDVAIVYGVNDSFTTRIQEFVSRGYATHMMTGAAWGGYHSYINGKFDGKQHQDEGQVDPQGNVIWHNDGIPYMVPSPSFAKYLASLACKAIDAGATAVHYEEPEFWSRAGYSEGFKRLWQAEYNEEWRRPDSSPDAFWRAARLKYLLYKRALGDVFAQAKQYAASKGRVVKCFVPTHSLVNYSQWSIVSPESSLMDLPNCDGYIAQVWTGTARTPNTYRGVKKERTFETAFLEYASMFHMVAPTGRKVYFLADPVEDDPTHTWDDYRANYERVVTASLLFPEVSDFEVMPWPDRVFTAPYPAGSYGETTTSTVVLPPSYATELMVVVNALNEMNHDKWKWQAGSRNVAVLVSDTMMFHRASPWTADEDFSQFFGLAMPLVKHGMPCKLVVLERIDDPKAFEGVDVLLMSYEHMKPMKREHSLALAKWVRNGGALAYFGSDSNAFAGVREWWNDDGQTSSTPGRQLFKMLGVKASASDEPMRAGKGWFMHNASAPKQLAHARKGGDVVRQTAAELLQLRGKQMATSNHIVLERGPFVIGAVLKESLSGKSLCLKGTYVDLFSSSAQVRKNPEFKPGEVFFLRHAQREADDAAFVTPLASSGRIEQTDTRGGVWSALLRGPAGAPGILRFACERKPTQVRVDGEPGKWSWDDASRTALVSFEPHPEGRRISIESRNAGAD